MHHPVLTLDPGDVEMAMSDQTAQWLLDPVTGKLCMDPEDAAFYFGREEVETWSPTDPERVLPIPHFSSFDGYRLMERFALEHAGPGASQRLQQALDQRKPFRGFKDALGEFPEDRQRWFEFESEEKKRIAEEFYEDEGYAVRWTDSPGEPTGLL